MQDWKAYEVAEITAFADAFEKEYSDKVSTWKSRLQSFKNDNKSVVVWGAGSKGVTFLNVLDAQDEIMCVVDLNPNKHDKYVPGTGHPVVDPEYIRENPPHVVLVMNRIYADEIANSLADMQVDCEVVVV
jgi:ABC-type Fe3+-hydroxamate transport system substrate-binding protein